MSNPTKSAALRTTRFLLAAITILLAIAGIGALLVSFGLPWQGEVAVADPGGMARSSLPGSLVAFGGMSLIALAALFGILWRIAGSVLQGDPFIPANANRLHWMGWVALAHWVTGLASTVSGASYRGNPGLLDWNLTPLVLAICLFIIAKVFKHGTGLRDDLEGTV